MTLFDGRTQDEWFLELETQIHWMECHALTAFALLGIPESLADIGCGIGTVVRLAAMLGIESYGVDQLANQNFVNATLFRANLVETFTLPKPVNMVWCTEVAEHLDQSAHATLCDTLADNLAEGRGNYLVFSSAYPNQDGSGHLSERPSKYWKDQFALRDLNFRKDLTVNLALLWSNINSPLFWLAANVMVFEK